MDLLNCAFDSFTKASKSLEASYQALQQRIAVLTLELKDKNARLGEALREAEKNKDYLDAVLYSMEEAIIVLDSAERITMTNRAAGLMLGEAAQGATGKKFSELDISLGADGSLKADGSVAVLEAGGRKYNVIIEDSPVIDSTGASLGRVIQLKDVTRMMQMEALHERNQRLISLGEMAAKIVHEIRNPLCSMELFASMLERDVPEGKTKELACGISAGIHSLNNILTNMLFFARPHRPSFACVELKAVVEEVLRGLAPFMETRKARAETVFEKNKKPGPAPLAVQGDAELLKQILMNLMINAIQAMPGGGLIRVRLGENDGSPFIEVKDEGEGIPAGLMERIFDPFFSTKEKGTGLGLAIASKIMQAHGGYIKASSEPGKGSSFSMCFSLAACDEVRNGGEDF